MKMRRVESRKRKKNRRKMSQRRKRKETNQQKEMEKMHLQRRRSFHLKNLISIFECLLRNTRT
jgi:hypothetical protein